ncbi:histidine--tRNA ligase [bacterium]|nr:histidine--tRNA ligase [bacterium]
MLPKGTRDILPLEKKRRVYLQNTLAEIFECFGYQPIETPALELFKTLSGKYGEEGERLMFKLLPRGAKFEQLSGLSATEMGQHIEEALRYDLTVPFARFVVDHRSELTLPFKRYQMQQVWRADRPQKGRFREFTQCDADVAGPGGMVQEAELIQLYDWAFERFALPVEIRVNHRSLLQGLAALAGCPDRFVDFAVGLDKLDKVGWDGVRADWAQRQLFIDWERISWMSLGDTAWSAALERYKQHLSEEALAQRGLADLHELDALLHAVPPKHAQLRLDPSLARGLDYYTGCIFEVSALGVELGSIGGGGRYDNLTGLFGLPGVGGVGISFGLERIALALEQLHLFPDSISAAPPLLMAHLGGEAGLRAFTLTSQWRRSGRAVEFYPKEDKLRKQMEYADKSGIRWLGMIGLDEIQNNTLSIKDLKTGIQKVFGQLETEAIFDFVNA